MTIWHLKWNAQMIFLRILAAHKTKDQFLCGFSMETENMLENSRKKLKKKNLDMIIANSLKMEGAGFGGNTNVVTVITEDFEKELGKLTKEETADRILDQILATERGSLKDDTDNRHWKYKYCIGLY